MLTLSCLASAAIHGPVYLSVKWLADNYMTSVVRRNEPVKVVRLSSDAWDRSMEAAKKTQQRAIAQGRGAERQPEVVVKKAEPEKPKPKPKTKLKGQIVEVPPTADDSQNPEAKYLSKYNSNVEKESVARIEDRDPTKKRVTNKLQERDISPARPEPGAIPTKGLTTEGKDDRGEPTSDSIARADTQKKQTIIQVPDVAQEDAVQLELSEVPGERRALPNRRGTEAIRGNGDQLRLQLGEDLLNSPSNAAGRRGSETGKEGLPSLSALRPTMGTIARMTGSPSRDHIVGVPEGDGTFLNTKEFKYATFFYRVRDSVAGHWDDLVAQEYRRRDPSGNIYGVRNRATLLAIELSVEGRLTGVRVASSSGVDFLDAVAVEAFKMAEPFPNPPLGIADTDGNIRFTFQFTVVHSRGPFNLFR